MIAKIPVVSGIPFVVEIKHECPACAGNRPIQLLLRTTFADSQEETLSKLETLNASEFRLKVLPNIFGVRGPSGNQSESMIAKLPSPPVSSACPSLPFDFLGWESHRTSENFILPIDPSPRFSSKSTSRRHLVKTIQDTCASSRIHADPSWQDRRQ
jgi:hypothetical protein